MVSLLAVVACGKNNKSGKSNPGSTQNPVIGQPIPGIGNAGSVDALVNEFIGRVNERRQAIGLNPVVRDGALEQVALQSAANLAQYPNANLSICRSLALGTRGRFCRAIMTEGGLQPVSILGEMLRYENVRRTNPVIRAPLATRAGVGIAQDFRGQFTWVLVLSSHN